MLSLVEPLGLWCDGLHTGDRQETVHGLWGERVLLQLRLHECVSVRAQCPAGGSILRAALLESSPGQWGRPSESSAFWWAPRGVSFPSPSIPSPFLDRISRGWILKPRAQVSDPCA